MSKLLTQTERTAVLATLQAALLQAAQAAQVLVSDDLRKLERGRDAHGVKALSLIAHRAQLAHGQVLELVPR